ncbi:glycosyl transferase family 2 [Litoreibacter halocynthiae]|uniref:Glycosyl transferase family 2 n=1 Tax=Litoreibacter halocynthiae TaxID=1242689 RepID=A0A4R7LEY5_9RHOB|nr:glycosyltransferase family 2 protein [Litoreibacter halocynthiae]TDT73132.1 glycosyl transferase family 2 [Litoreibacter halocynthiae]
MKKTDVTAIINAHNEGLILTGTLKSVSKAVQRAEEGGLSVEVMVVADRCDDLTQDVLNDFDEIPVKLVEGDNGDLAESRNQGVKLAEGEFIAFIDGDDLWGADWLLNAVEAARKEKRECIWHPEVNLYFAENHQWFFHHHDMDSPDFKVENLLVINYWTALSFARKKVYVDNPYVRNQISKGMGYEDWSWNCSTIAKGLVHKVVPETCHFVRKKEFSLVRESVQADVMVSRHGLYNHLFQDKKRKFAKR